MLSDCLGLVLLMLPDFRCAAKYSCRYVLPPFLGSAIIVPGVSTVSGTSGTAVSIRLDVREYDDGLEAFVAL